MRREVSESRYSLFYNVDYCARLVHCQSPEDYTQQCIVGTDLSAVITWAGLGLSAAEPHAL